jgi:hypothetical protein
MAVVAVPYNEPWKVARWAFRMLIEKTLSGVPDEEDRYVLRQAVALDGLIFDSLDPPQATRIAQAMEVAADELRFELLASDSTDPRDRLLADALAVLEMRLHDIHE